MLKATGIKKNILAIETSCDDTCIAVIKNDQIASNIVISSAKDQANYGGVVPELAARKHEQNIINAFKMAINKSNLILTDVDYIAYTSNPGLRVCLNVGESFAYSLSTILKKPLIPINHLCGHIFSFWDLKSPIQYPIISLVASGGHTSLFYVNDCFNFKVINETSDDAIGECYDKIARELNLGYPGGPVIDKIFDINKAHIKFLTKNINPSDPFSFSGLKTAVLNYINQKKMKHEEIDIISIASSFQKEAIDIIINKMIHYSSLYPNASISVGGGVCANKYFRKLLQQTFVNKKLYLPDSSLSGDNAAMIGIYAKLIT